jgi:hypothetical protein
MNEPLADILLLGAEWRERALLRAQLIEDGYDVVAIDAWPIPELFRLPAMLPRLLIIDLQGLPNPRETLEEVRRMFPAGRVLVLTALGTVSAADIRRLGLTAIDRPATIGQVAEAVRTLLASRSGSA